MTRSVRAIAVGCALAALGLAPGAVGATAPKVYWPGCGLANQKPKYKPTKIVITCADASFRVTKIEWSSWGSKQAKGSGTAKVNTCDPSCAAGHFKSYPIHLRAYRPHDCAHADKREFSRLKYVFPDRRPKGYGRRDLQKFPCGG